MRLKEPRKEGGRKRLPSLGFSSSSSSFFFSFSPFSSASLGSLSFRLNEPRSDGGLNRLLFCAAPSSSLPAGSGSASAAGAGAGALKLIVPLSDHAPSPAGRGAQSGQPQRA